MPNDLRGTELRVGDSVRLMGRIKSLEDTPEGQNVEVEVEAPPGERRTTVHINSRALVLDD